MPDNPAITIVKEFQYRAKDEEWSNTYHFAASPAAEDWGTTIDALVAQEKTCYGAQVKVVRAYGYDGGSDHAVFVKDFTTGTPPVGTLVAGGTGKRDLPGDCAATVRWGTNSFTSRGKRIYLRKYFHGAWGEPGTNPDELHHGQRDALAAFATFLEGADPIGIGAYRSDTGLSPIGHLVAPSVTMRQLKRRGRRPLVSP